MGITAVTKGKSGWTFVTSASTGGSIGYFGAEGGYVALQDPRGNQRNFYYASAGAGLSWSFGNVRLSSLGKIEIGGAGLATADMTSSGSVWILSGFPRDELTARDIRGGCIFAEVGAGVLVAGSAAYAMLVGMNPAWLAAAAALSAGGPLAMSYPIMRYIKSATALVFMGGESVQLVPAAGASVFGGILSDNPFSKS